MMNKRIYKHIARLLLFAMFFASVPVHQLFHKHREAEKSATGLHLKKFEKPCCSVFEGISGDVVTSPPAFKAAPSFGTYITSYFSRETATSFFHFSNKAPPVVIA